MKMFITKIAVHAKVNKAIDAACALLARKLTRAGQWNYTSSIVSAHLESQSPNICNIEIKSSAHLNNVELLEWLGVDLSLVDLDPETITYDAYDN